MAKETTVPWAKHLFLQAKIVPDKVNQTQKTLFPTMTKNAVWTPPLKQRAGQFLRIGVDGCLGGSVS